MESKGKSVLLAILLLGFISFGDGIYLPDGGDQKDTNHSVDDDLQTMTVSAAPDLSDLFFMHGYSFLPADTPMKIRLALEENTWHWYPWRPTSVKIVNNPELEERSRDCPPGSSIDDFPDDLFTNEQRLNGAIILHIIFAIYCFTLSGMCINNYFIPSIQIICDLLKIPADVGAAVFMATGTAMPELFVNIISTFLTESDMGLGTIIGSLMFNILGVAGIACFFAIHTINLDWWPITRDSVIFTVIASFLIGFGWDGRIEWYESMILVILIIFYYGLMIFNARLQRGIRYLLEDRLGCCANIAIYSQKEDTITEKFSSNGASVIPTGNGDAEKPIPAVSTNNVDPKQASTENDEGENSLVIKTRLFEVPRSVLHICWWLYTWPARFLLFITIPNAKRYKRLFPITFIMCIVWIAIISYLIFWMLTIIGYTFTIPESVMGLTFLAIGGCTPELLTASIMARKGDGSFGVSNSLGASSLAILLSLGLPFMLRSIIDKAQGLPQYVYVGTYGMQWILLTLLGVVGSLYLVISLARYTLRKTVGFCLLFAYIVFITFAVLVEVDIFFPSGRDC